MSPQEAPRGPDFHGKGDPLMEVAFASCVRWAHGDAETRELFEQETGRRFPKGGLDQLIDEATGNDEELAGAFVGWVAERLWGGDEG